MAEITYKITNILGGHAPTKFFATSEGQFLSSVGIDPDQRGTGSFSSKMAGIITPVAYAEFSGAAVDNAPMWIITNPKNTSVYSYLFNGGFISHSSVLGSETDIGTPTSGAGNGSVYYNNHIYLMTPTDVSRYGRLDGTPAITNTVWTGSTLGSQKALIDTTYPTVQGINYPNHAGHVHSDDSLYFCDFVSGAGVIHKIKTAPTLDYDAQSGNFTVGLTVTGGTSDATAEILADSDAGATGTLTLGEISGVFQDNENITDTSTGDATVNGTLKQGDGDNGSQYNVLDLPFGFMPMDIESYGEHLAVIATQTSDTTIDQGNAQLFLWDTFADSFYNQVPLDDPLGTSLYNQGGVIKVFSGNANNGFRVGQYYGGKYMGEDLDFFEEGYSPFAGAVDSYGSRLSLGTSTTDPINALSVFSYGYKNPKLPRNARHSTVHPTSSGDNKLLTSLKYVQQASGITPRMVVGWKDDSAQGLDDNSGTDSRSVFRSEIFIVERPFVVSKIRIPIPQAISSSDSIVCRIFFDGGTQSKILPTINNTNYPDKKTIVFRSEEIAESSATNIIHEHDFFLQLTWSLGTISVSLPIEITVTTFDDD